MLEIIIQYRQELFSSIPQQKHLALLNKGNKVSKGVL